MSSIGGVWEIKPALCPKVRMHYIADGRSAQEFERRDLKIKPEQCT